MISPSARELSPDSERSSFDLEKNVIVKAKTSEDNITKWQQARVLLATALSSFVVMGLTQAFGVFQAHYGRIDAVHNGILRPEGMKNRAGISAIGSLSNGGIIALFALLYYPYLPRMKKYIKYLCLLGAFFVMLGFGGAALSQNLPNLIATQGLLVGIGSGIQLYLLAPIITEYFPQRSGLAQGVVGAAASLGGVTFSLSITSLLEKLGAKQTLTVVTTISGIILATASMLCLPPRKLEKRSTSIISFKACKDPLFLCLCAVNLIHPLTLAVPMTFGPQFVQSIGGKLTFASQLLAINSGVGVPARLGAGALADKIGHLNTLLLATAIYALATWTFWLPSALTGNIGLYVAMSVCHGTITGCFNAVINTVQKRLFGDELYYPMLGATTSIRGLGYVLGVPLAGLLVSRVADEKLTGRDFLNPILFVGSLLTVSVACIIAIRCLDARRQGWAWKR